MNDLTSIDTSSAASIPSTVIDTHTDTAPSGAGVPRIAAEDKAPSLRDTIASVVKEGDTPTEGGKDGEPAKGDGKAKVEADDGKKPVEADAKKEGEDKAQPRGENGKFASTKDPEAAEGDAATEGAQAKEGAEKPAKYYNDPPKSFLGDSREKWANVPHPVRRDIDIMVREHETQMQQAREHVQRYEAIRPFDDLARQNGRDLRESLTKLNEVENSLRRDPVFGLNEILREIGPRKPDGQPFSIYEVAAHIVNQGPDAYNQQMQQARMAQPQQPDPKVMQMQQELEDARAQLISAQVIAPFKAQNPRYEELQEPIAQFLKSDIIDRSLNPAERLEMAYVMADRVYPSSSNASPAPPVLAPEDRAAESLNGSKSIRSAPGAVSSDMEPERGGSIRDILNDEVRRLRRS